MKKTENFTLRHGLELSCKAKLTEGFIQEGILGEQDKVVGFFNGYAMVTAIYLM